MAAIMRQKTLALRSQLRDSEWAQPQSEHFPGFAAHQSIAQFL